MYQPLIKFHPYPAIITQVLRIFAQIQLVAEFYEKIYHSSFKPFVAGCMWQSTTKVSANDPNGKH